jgi:CspA family cold shock protein
MPIGTVKWYNEAQGLGIIRTDLDGKEYSVSHDVIVGDGFKVLVDGQRVFFEILETHKGRTAVQVREIG